MNHSASIARAFDDTCRSGSKPPDQTGLRVTSTVSELDLDIVHGFLSEHSSWARGIPRPLLERAIEHSICFGGFIGSDQVAFARVVTDRATFANLVDVFVLAAHRREGYLVFTLDMRGHGASGTRGHIDYIGQLDDDLAAFLKAVRPPPPSTLAGFSSGGGFVLRIAGGSRQDLFDSYLLLSPFLSQDAPNQRPASGGWVDVGIPRIVALSVLNALGVTAFNRLPVTAFALDDQAAALLTPTYDFTLATNFRPRPDFAADIRNSRGPLAVLAGTADEAFDTQTLGGIFGASGKQGRTVHLLPGVGHASLILDSLALAATVEAVDILQRTPTSHLL